MSRDSERTKTSRALTSILRHRAVEEGLTISADGYVPVSELLALPRFRSLTVEELSDIVASCPKQRFEMKRGDVGALLIRATQGHTIASLKDDEMLTKITDPAAIPVAVHGSYTKVWPSIKAHGLNKMTRNHIHLARGEPGRGGVISGARSNCDLLIYVDVAAAMAAGIEFFESSNGVILTRGIDGILPPAYFSRVVQIGRRGRPDTDLPFDRIPVTAAASAASASIAPVTVPSHAPRPVGAGAWAKPLVPPKPRASTGGAGGGAGTSDSPVAPSASASASASSVSSAPSTPSCPFKYLLVLDFEATCDTPVQTSPQEIIEFPTVVIDVASGAIVDEFRRFVKPVVHPVLSAFCTELTGITNADVSGEAVQPFTATFAAYTKWLVDSGYMGDHSCFVTCGDWDLKSMLPGQLTVSGLRMPSDVVFKRWINLKKAFNKAYRAYPRGMTEMLEKLRLPLVGRHHSGIDDCRNIAAVALRMLAEGKGDALTPTFKA